MPVVERTRLQQGTFLVLFVLAAYAFWRTLEPIWVPVLLGLLIAVGVHPIHERLLRRLGGKHPGLPRSEEHTSELQSQSNLVCRLLLEKKKKKNKQHLYTKKKIKQKKNN